MPFSATAEGNVSDGTCSLTEDCQAGPNSAIAAADDEAEGQQDLRRDEVEPRQHRQRRGAAERDSTSETSATMRRSYMSAMAPAGIEISMIGSIKAVCTSATLSADDVICVMAQAAPTPWINKPRLDSRLASQMRRNAEYRKRSGDAVGGKPRDSLFSHSRFPLTPSWPA